MKTALQELLDWMNSQMFIKPKDLYSKVKELLPKEKEQIEIAFEEGMYNAAIVNFGFGDEYYIKTYETDEEIL